MSPHLPLPLLPPLLSLGFSIHGDVDSQAAWGCRRVRPLLALLKQTGGRTPVKREN
jgi:hypothetical protein